MQTFNPETDPILNSVEFKSYIAVIQSLNKCSEENLATGLISFVGFYDSYRQEADFTPLIASIAAEQCTNSEFMSLSPVAKLLARKFSLKYCLVESNKIFESEINKLCQGVDAFLTSESLKRVFHCDSGPKDSIEILLDSLATQLDAIPQEEKNIAVTEAQSILDFYHQQRILPTSPLQIENYFALPKSTQLFVQFFITMGVWVSAQNPLLMSYAVPIMQKMLKTQIELKKRAEAEASLQ